MVDQRKVFLAAHVAGEDLPSPFAARGSMSNLRIDFDLGHLALDGLLICAIRFSEKMRKMGFVVRAFGMDFYLFFIFEMWKRKDSSCSLEL